VTSGSIVVLGGSGLVGSRVLERWNDDHAVVAPTHAELDVLDQPALHAFLQQARPRTVVNAAAWADVDGAEPERGNTDGQVYRLNVEYPRQLAHWCGEAGAHLIHLSTDYVFDGVSQDRPYSEQDPTNPLGWYAQTKWAGEQAVLQADQAACVARIEMPFTGQQHHKRDLARTIVVRLEAGQAIQGVTDQRITPVFLDDAVEALRKLAEARYSGIIHIAASDWTTPYAFGCWIARRLDLPAELVRPATFQHFAATRPAPRPQHSWLDVSRFAKEFGTTILRPVEAELASWVEQMTSVRSSS
jgi:dTDP-4-dehydrorhamnose reductase